MGDKEVKTLGKYKWRVGDDDKLQYPETSVSDRVKEIFSSGDIAPMAGTLGGGALGYYLASKLMGDEDKKKMSSWDKLLRILIPLGSSGLGAYAGYELTKGASYSPEDYAEYLDAVADYANKVQPKAGPYRTMQEAAQGYADDALPGWPTGLVALGGGAATAGGAAAWLRGYFKNQELNRARASQGIYNDAYNKAQKDLADAAARDAAAQSSIGGDKRSVNRANAASKAKTEAAQSVKELMPRSVAATSEITALEDAVKNSRRLGAGGVVIGGVTLGLDAAKAIADMVRYNTRQAKLDAMPSVIGNRAVPSAPRK